MSHGARISALILGVAALLCCMLAWGWVTDQFSDPNCRLSTNAAWISVDWVNNPVDENAVRQLVSDAAAREMQYLFAYVSYLSEDGIFNPSYDFAADFAAVVRTQDSEIQVLAWIGLPLTNERSIGVQGWVELSNPDTRRYIVEFIADFLQTSGFDGIHLNAETVQNGDPDFLLLLNEIRQQVGPELIISVAGSHWVPDSLNRLPPVRDFRWSGAYYRSVAKQVDQIAVMAYDSHAFMPFLYRLWVREQIKGISRYLRDIDIELLVGISVSREHTRSHIPKVETLANGLAGLCAGMKAEKVVQGAAIYADWEFSFADREVWQEWQE